MSGATGQIARWAAGQGRDQVPGPVGAHVRRLLLDHLGGVIAASRYRAARLVADYAMLACPGQEATAVGFGLLSADGAALVNGTAAHSLEVDDGYTPGAVHPSAVVFPAVLAAAQRHGCEPERVVAAASAGLELTCRIAAAGHPATWRAGFHNTSLAGVLGATAGVGVLLRLDHATMEHALGIAASHAGGLFAFLGHDAEIKRLHAGKAARDALASAELAARGLTGPPGVLEGAKGYFAAFAGGHHDPAALIGGLGTDWVMLRTYVKPYPCCRHLHGPIDATLQLRAGRGPGPDDDVTAIEVGTYEVAAKHSATTVGSLLGAQMSIPHAVAVAWLRGAVGMTEFEPPAWTSDQVRALTAKVSVTVDPAADAAYPGQRPATVTVRRAGRPALTAHVAQPYGEPGNPVSDEALAEKFGRLCAPVIGAARVRETIDAIRNLADLSFLARLAS